MTTIKMSQILQDWQENATEYVKGPRDTSKDHMLYIGLTPAVQETLKKIDAIGFNISTQDQALKVTEWLADPSILAAIMDMTDYEYAEVYSKYVKGTPPPPQAHDLPSAPPTVGDVVQGNLGRVSMRMVAQYQHEEMVELIRLLMDAGFRMDDHNTAVLVLGELGASNSPSADMAQHLMRLTSNEALYDQMMNEAAGGAKYQNPTPWSMPSKIPNTPSYGPLLDQSMPGRNPIVKTKQELEQENLESQQDLQKHYQEIDKEVQSPAYQEQIRQMQDVPAAPPTPPPTTPAAPPPSMAPPAPTPPKAPAAPALGLNYVPGQGGAQGKAKALSEMASMYSQMQNQLPRDVIPAIQGETIAGVYPETRQKSDFRKETKVLIRGGEMVAAYDQAPGRVENPEEAMVVGKTKDGKLAVFTFPYMQPAIWDVDAREVRKSLRQPKRQ